MAIESLKKHMVIAPLICNNITFWLYTGSKQKGCLGCLGGEREERQESSSSRRTQNNTGGTDKEEEEEREREQKERGIGKEQEQESRRELKDCWAAAITTSSAGCFWFGEKQFRFHVRSRYSNPWRLWCVFCCYRPPPRRLCFVLFLFLFCFFGVFGPSFVSCIVVVFIGDLWLGLHTHTHTQIDRLSVCALKRWWKPVRFVCFLVSPGKRSKLHCCVVFWIAVFQWKGALWSWLSLLAFAALSVYGFSFSSRFSLESCFLLHQKSFWLEAADWLTQ